MRFKRGLGRVGRHSEPAEPVFEVHERAELEDRPEVVLTLLEPDQLVAAKERTRFGRRRLSAGQRVLLWSLRVYVVVMLAVLLFSVIGTIRGAR